MKRQFAIFLIVSVVMAVWGLTYLSGVVADFTVYPTTIDGSGTRIVLRPNVVSPNGKYVLDVQDSQRVIKQRLEQMHLTGPSEVTVHGNQLAVRLPNNKNTPYVINIITHVGEVEFIDGGNISPPVGKIVNTGAESAYEENVYQTLFTGQEISTIVPSDPAAGDIFYQIELKPAAAQRVANFTNAETNTYACLAIDKQVINCSEMYYLSGNTLDILPKLNAATNIGVADMAIFLRSGPLPMSLEVVTN